MPLKVTDYGAMEKWIQNVKTGNLSHERPTNQSDQHLSEDKTVVRDESRSDILPKRSTSTNGQHTDHREVVGIPVVHESCEHDSARLESRNYTNVKTTTTNEPQECIVAHVEKSRREIDDETLEYSPSDYSVASGYDPQYNIKLRERVDELDDTDLFELTHHEIIMGVVEAHDRASLHLKELQKSCDAIHQFKDDLCKKMFEAECTGQLEGNISEEWRMYVDIAGNVDDYFLRRPDLMQYTKPQGSPELESRYRFGGYNTKKTIRMMNQGTHRYTESKESKHIEDTQEIQTRESNDCGNGGEDNRHKRFCEAKRSSEAINLVPVLDFPPISLASWELDKDSKSQESNTDTRSDDPYAIENSHKTNEDGTKESEPGKEMNDRSPKDQDIAGSSAADLQATVVSATVDTAEVSNLRSKA